MDPLDAEATAERPALTASARRAVRRRVRVEPRADATSEVALEDVLLEVYAEDPPPPPSRRVPPLPASVQGAAVDALLRASQPTYPSFQASDFSEAHSVAPVMLASTVAPPARPILGARRPNRAAAFAIWSVVLLVFGVAGGAAITLAVQNGTYARLRDGAKSRAGASREGSTAVPAVTAPAPAPSPAVAPPPVPTIAVDSLPKSEIPPDIALVTFPASAQGHRVFVDGRLVTVVPGEPAKIKCGRHVVKMGSGRRPRVVDLACGREVVLP